jgi:hypothetical protein
LGAGFGILNVHEPLALQANLRRNLVKVFEEKELTFRSSIGIRFSF